MEVKVEIELENTLDRGMALRGLLPDDQVRSFKDQVLADTGAVMLVLPQDEVEALGLPEVRKAVVKSADERTEERSVAGPVTVRVDSRAATVDCISRSTQQRAFAWPRGAWNHGLARRSVAAKTYASP